MPRRPFDPKLLDALEKQVLPWEGVVWRVVLEGTDALRENTRGSRWNPPDLATLYCSLEPRGAEAELQHLLSLQPFPINVRKVTHKIAVKLSRVADLRDLSPLAAFGVSQESVTGKDWGTAQLIGDAVAWLRCGGLLVPSARHSGSNLVVFLNSMAPEDTVQPLS